MRFIAGPKICFSFIIFLEGLKQPFIMANDNCKPLGNLRYCFAEHYAEKKTGRENKTKAEPTEKQTRAQTMLEDIFISIKTTGRFHETRLKAVVETWLQDAVHQTYIVTDAEDSVLRKHLPENHLIVTNCSSGHNHNDLNCKMMHELAEYYKTDKRWFCHFDDDNYLNVANLIALLQQHNHTKDWYLGKPSLKRRIEVQDSAFPGQKVAFWFATGGAGFCVSQPLARKMMPYVLEEQFMNLARRYGIPDDCMVGCIIDYLLHTNLTVVSQFHSHLEQLNRIGLDDIKKHITFSYHQDRSGRWNRIKIDGLSLGEDPTRFLSIHCFLQSQLPMCVKNNN